MLYENKTNTTIKTTNQIIDWNHLFEITSTKKYGAEVTFNPTSNIMTTAYTRVGTRERIVVFLVKLPSSKNKNDMVARIGQRRWWNMFGWLKNNHLYDISFVGPKINKQTETKISEASQSAVAKSIAESTEEATSAEAAEKALVSTLISNMDQLKSYITGDVVNGVIGSDIEVTEAMELGCDKVLNLNGHTLSVNMSSGRPFVFSHSQSMVVNANDGGMKITNNNAYGLFRIQSPDVKLTLNGGNYEGYVEGAAAIIWVGNVNNQLTHNVDIELNNLNVSCVGQFVRDTSCDGDTLKVNGGNYTFNNAGINVNGSISGFVLQYMDVEFNGVTATSAIGSIMELDGGNGLFKDNNFTVQNSNNIQGWNATTIGVAYEATIKVESGVYSGFFGISVFTSGGHIIMNGGTVVGTSHAFDLYDDDNRLGNNQVTTLDIYGGTVTGDIYKEGSEAVVKDHR